ncbi:MAG: hypothetical protein NWF01_08440 [Candidatus Bathyarchaeota archaeon]|nr:hypothetical protein [Candidatus Bathyarchaeota archaeon]
MNKKIITAITLILMICATAIASVSATTTVNVYIYNPFDAGSEAQGINCNGHWVGDIPIDIISGGSTFHTNSYCMDFDRDLNVGTTYQATITSAADTAEWRAVSYVLSWNSPTNDNEAAVVAVAIWRLLNQTRGTTYFRESWLDQSIDSAGNVLSTLAYGKDVVRQGDQLTWTSPITGNMSAVMAEAGETVTFQANLASSTGTPRANVKVLLSATLTVGSTITELNSTYVTPSEMFTDTAGNVQVDVQVPPDTPNGASITVKAQTQSIWSQRYIDTTNPAVQDLIGIGDNFQLTVSTNLCILGTINVLPESPIGTIMAISAAGVGFAVWVKFKHPKNWAKTNSSLS